MIGNDSIGSPSHFVCLHDLLIIFAVILAVFITLDDVSSSQQRILHEDFKAFFVLDFILILSLFSSSLHNFFSVLSRVIKQLNIVFQFAAWISSVPFRNYDIPEDIAARKQDTPMLAIGASIIGFRRFFSFVELSEDLK